MTPRAAFLALTTAASVRAAGFMDQGCTTPQSGPWALEGSRISSHCNDHICGVQAYTTLDLNMCLGNDHGKLVARKNGNFADSCRDCQVSHDFGSLICSCDDVTTGVSHISQFNMKADNTIYNWYGYLSCFGVHDEHTAPHDVSHCGAAAPAAGVHDPLSCEGCTSGPIDAVGDAHQQVSKQDQVHHHDQATKATKAPAGRRAVVRPQWKTTPDAVVDEVQVPEVEQSQVPQVQTTQQQDNHKTQQDPRNVVKTPQVQKQDEVAKDQQQPRGVVTTPQIKAPVVNEETQGSFHARRSSKGAQNQASTDTNQAGQAVAAQVQEQQTNSVQDVYEPRLEAMDAHMHDMMASQSVRRSSTPDHVIAVVDSGIGAFPRPVTDQRQVHNGQDMSVGSQHQEYHQQKHQHQHQQDQHQKQQHDQHQHDQQQKHQHQHQQSGSLEKDQRPVADTQNIVMEKDQCPVADTQNVVMVPRGFRLGGGPVEGMGPVVHVVDGRQ